ncbi:hypothetical protein J6590_087199 [Homalodisca vitripennis]|nr:hypothetical protein J6590_087199 [Homalodisca vitripennis]
MIRKVLRVMWQYITFVLHVWLDRQETLLVVIDFFSYEQTDKEKYWLESNVAVHHFACYTCCWSVWETLETLLVVIDFFSYEQTDKEKYWLESNVAVHHFACYTCCWSVWETLYEQTDKEKYWLESNVAVHYVACYTCGWTVWETLLVVIDFFSYEQTDKEKYWLESYVASLCVLHVWLDRQGDSVSRYRFFQLRTD